MEWGTCIADQEGVCASVICGEPKRGFYGKSGLVVEVGNPGEGSSEGGGIVLFRMAKGKGKGERR